jgi:hypothetical protein
MTQRDGSGGDERRREIGRLGGEATKRTLGPAHFSRIGKKGGQALLAARGRDYYAAIGRLGGKRRKEEQA